MGHRGRPCLDTAAGFEAAASLNKYRRVSGAAIARKLKGPPQVCGDIFIASLLRFQLLLKV